jgi:membrane protein required for colicin V production
MTAFDYVILALIVLSAGIGLWRGVIREVFALGAWVVAIVCAVLFGQAVALALPLAGQAAWLQSLAGYALVFVGVFIVLSVLGFVFTKMVRAVGLSFIDRALGMMFGVLRGALIAVLLVLVAGATGLPQADWWKESSSAKPLETFAALLRSKFPDDLAKRFKVATASLAHGADGLPSPAGGRRVGDEGVWRIRANSPPASYFVAAHTPPSPQPSPACGIGSFAAKAERSTLTPKDSLCAA